VDKDEVTLVLPAHLIDEFGARLPSDFVHTQRYRLITFDVVLDMGIIGLMAQLSDALAQANISILTYAAFSRDHLLVPAVQFDAAMNALEHLKQAK